MQSGLSFVKSGGKPSRCQCLAGCEKSGAKPWHYSKMFSSSIVLQPTHHTIHFSASTDWTHLVAFHLHSCISFLIGLLTVIGSASIAIGGLWMQIIKSKQGLRSVSVCACVELCRIGMIKQPCALYSGMRSSNEYVHLLVWGFLSTLQDFRVSFLSSNATLKLNGGSLESMPPEHDEQLNVLNRWEHKCCLPEYVGPS